MVNVSNTKNLKSNYIYFLEDKNYEKTNSSTDSGRHASDLHDSGTAGNGSGKD